MLPSKLIVRQSCAARPEAVVQAALGSFTPCPEDFAQTSAASKAAFLSQLPQPIRYRARWRRALKGCLMPCSLICWTDRRGASVELAAVLEAAARHGMEVSNWQDTVSLLRRCLLPALNQGQRVQAEDLFGQARS